MFQTNNYPPAKIILSRVAMVYPGGDDGILALDDCSISVRADEFLCILGPSGSGKSTIVHLVAGFLCPSKGSLLVNGRRVDGPSTERGVVFQRHNLFPWKRVSENIAFGSRLQKLPRGARQTVLDEYVDLMELSGFEDCYPSELSEGMQQRVGIARAYANEPEILLMDEPFASLDGQTCVKMREMLLRIWGAKRKTVMFVTHDIDEAIQLADRVVLLTRRPGRVKEEFLVELPRPRSRDFFSDSRYTELRARMLVALFAD